MGLLEQVVKHVENVGDHNMEADSRILLYSERSRCRLTVWVEFVIVRSLRRTDRRFIYLLICRT